MKAQNKVSLAAVLFLVIAFTRAEAQLTYGVTDLGTLGGNTSTANGVVAQGTNASGMIVGSSTTNDNSEHAFLYVNGQMFDLNTLCDLSQSDFKVLTVAKTINDSCLIIGEGITTNGDKHAFLLTPLPVDGGQWSYVCCQWVWIQQGGGWWWEENCGCYKWHGPPGRHPPCPPRPPPCWRYPLPCCQTCQPPPTTPTPTPPRQTPTPSRQTPTVTPTLPPPVRRTPTPPITYIPGVLPTPTPTPPTTFIPGIVQPTPTPPRRRRGSPTPTPRTYTIKPLAEKTPTPMRTRSPSKSKKSTPTPTPYQIR